MVPDLGVRGLVKKKKKSLDELKTNRSEDEEDEGNLVIA